MPDHPFEPVCLADARVLILGSFPSVQSRAQGFYYGNPQNRFWRLLSQLLDEAEPQGIPARAALLARHRIALWDVVGSCSIDGSSDSSLRMATPNDIPSLLGRARIEKVLLNGKTAGRLYAQHFSHLGLPFFVLPSTSPANAAWPLDRLKAAWAPYLAGL